MDLELDTIKGIINYGLQSINEVLMNAEEGDSFGSWIFIGKSQIAFGTPAGPWDKDKYPGYLLKKDNYELILRIVPEQQLFALESLTLNSQLVNFTIKQKGLVYEDDKVQIKDKFSMTVSVKQSKEIVKKAMLMSGFENEVITTFYNKETVPEKNIREILDWGVYREKAKNLIKSGKLEKHKNPLKEFLRKNPMEQFQETKTSKEISLNQILYGPPGTGKTYNTINKAIEIVNPEFDLSLERKDVKNEYDRLVNEGQIVFTTFHQSMSYEDFIEGIKPIEPKEDTDPVHYKVENGIFKRICLNASKSKRNLITIDGKEQDLSKTFLEEQYKFFTSILPDQVNSSSNKILKTQSEYSFSLFKNSANSIVVRSGEEKTNMSVSLNELKNILFNGKLATYPSYAYPILKEIFKEYNWKEENVDNSQKSFVLIIDEINRGNVSQIFGELITLIEDDKREGKLEALEVTLPYSKEKFTVPSNLYIIGTMNTADRSVEALDTALRRRFSFQEMPPKSELIASEGKFKDQNGILEGIDLPKLLETINERIERLVDKDHKIGHSYFMSVSTVKDLRLAFQNKIIPLLQEYFFGDYGKIGLVIGEAFFENKGKQKSSSNIFASFNGYDSSVFMERPVYNIRNINEMSDPEFIKAITTLNPNLIASLKKEEELEEQV